MSNRHTETVVSSNEADTVRFIEEQFNLTCEIGTAVSTIKSETSERLNELQTRLHEQFRDVLMVRYRLNTFDKLMDELTEARKRLGLTTPE